MFTTKYSKVQPKPAKKRVRRYEDGGTVTASPDKQYVRGENTSKRRVTAATVMASDAAAISPYKARKMLLDAYDEEVAKDRAERRDED